MFVFSILSAFAYCVDPDELILPSDQDLHNVHFIYFMFVWKRLATCMARNSKNKNWFSPINIYSGTRLIAVKMFLKKKKHSY